VAVVIFLVALLPFAVTLVSRSSAEKREFEKRWDTCINWNSPDD
jgi:hypothetical protein